MQKKGRRTGWAAAKKLCRLNRNHLEMAKALGYGPDALVRARRDRNQKEWIRELHRERFGYVRGEKPLPPSVPSDAEPDPEEMRRFEEQLYWEDYWDRNEA